MDDATGVTTPTEAVTRASSAFPGVAVSVVVPVFNPGAYLAPLLASLDRQSLPPGRFETIFVDDGSTDGTATRLDEWCAERAHARVIHQENHGWPGQPRNVGIDAARGRYIQFVDQDDWLGDRALEQLVSYADAHGSDVVIGKMVGIRRRVPRALFRRSVPRVTIGVDAVQNSQTPHKLFRRAFLDEIGLRFPDDTRRLEDHLFVTTAFLRARVVSIYADDDCYFHTSRDDDGNAGFRAYDPKDYYAVVDDVLDLIDRLLPPGRARDVYRSRWLRVELVGRLGEPSVRNLPPARRRRFHDEIARVVRESFSPAEAEPAPAPTRIVAAVLRHASMQEYEAFARAVERVQVRAWTSEGGVRVRLLDGRRTMDAATTVARLLEAHLPARIRAAVLDDLGDAATAAILPDAVRLTRGTTRTALRRDGSVYRSESAAPRAGGTVHLALPIGPRETTLTASPRTGISSRLRKAARSARRKGAGAARRILGPRAVHRLRARWRRRD